ncbi:MAG: transglutaminase domain-containing protein [Ilumatobacteraceae bacterium]
MGLIRIRALVLALIGVLLALAAGRIFDSVRGALVVGALTPSLLLFPLLARRWYVQVPVALVAVVAAVVATVLVERGRVPDDVIDAVVRGPRRILSTEWPSPARADLVGAVAAMLAVASALSAWAASKPRWHILPLAPLLAAFVVICALSAAKGSGIVWLLPIAPPAVLFTVLRPERSSGERLRILAGERHLVPLTLVATGLAVAVSIPVVFADRADPRRPAPAETTAPVVDPIEATIALRRLDPPIVVYDVRAAGGVTTLPSRWRTSTLDTYDGRRWTPTLTLRPIGRRLAPDQPASIGADVEFGSDDVGFVPLPGLPILIGADVETDPARTVVRLVDRPTIGLVVPITAGVAPDRAEVAGAPLGVRPVDEIAAGFTDLATNLAGGGTVLERLDAIEASMRDEFALDSGAPGGGLQLALIERFLTETRRGNSEQFVTAFVLLARSLGVNTRVAAGFIVPAAELGDRIELRSDLARIWPEVEVPGRGWIAFDPVPDDETTDTEDPPAPPRAQTPAAPQPPIAPPENTTNDDVEPPTEVEPDDAGSWSTFTRWTVRTALALAAVIVPLLLVAGTIVALKAARRRRRLGIADERQRIRATWAVATDSLVDAGLTITPAWTDRQIAEQGSHLADNARHELVRLGAMSSAATYGPARLRDLPAADALAALGHIETSIRTPRTRWQRIRWRLSTRSLRRRTRSPVLGDA